jgi:hypothetical protein
MTGIRAVDVAKAEVEVEVDGAAVLVEAAEFEIEVDDAAVLVEAAELAQATHSRAIATEAAGQQTRRRTWVRRPGMAGTLPAGPHGSSNVTRRWWSDRLRAKVTWARTALAFEKGDVAALAALQRRCAEPCPCAGRL